MHQMKTEEIKITDLKPYEKNARKNDKAILVVKKSIEKFGFRNPIVVDENNQIVNGHTRFEAAKMIGFKSLPAFRLLKSDGWTETKIKAFRLMDNKSSEFAEWDYDKLKEELYSLESTDCFDFTGFDSKEIIEIWDKQEDTTPTEKVEKLGKHIITCPKCNHKFERK